MRVNDLAFVSDEAPDDAQSFQLWLVENAYTPGVTVTVRDMGRSGVDGGAPHVDVEGSPNTVMQWLLTHYVAEDPSALEDILSSGVEWGSTHAKSKARSTAVASSDPTEPAATDEWLKQFKPASNVWNLYTEFKVEKLTTDKLQLFLNDVSQGHSFLIGGEPADCVTTGEDGYEVIQVTHVGGRDWVAIMGNVGP